MRLIITMPVYEDWESAIELCRRIDCSLLQRYNDCASVVFIDDGSHVNLPPANLPFCPEAIESVSVLLLRRNLGHQRAIATGLAYIHEHGQADTVVVMDADGEDGADDIARLVQVMKDAPRSVSVFAERGRRLENTTFRVLYDVYRLLYRILTGRDIRFGNFSALPWSHLDSLVVYPELWNHYAATLVKSRLPYTRLRCDRQQRLAGKSRMDFVSLVVHGLSALFANQELVGTRLLVMLMITALVFLGAMGVVVVVRFATDLAIPGWATSTMGVALILMGQALIAAFVLIFSIMMNRSNLGFLPTRDYRYFIRREVTLFSR